LFEAQLAQPRRNVHAVILDSEESQPLVNEDIPLPVDLPAAELYREEPFKMCEAERRRRIEKQPIQGRRKTPKYRESSGRSVIAAVLSLQNSVAKGNRFATAFATCRRDADRVCAGLDR
jgi:hypothetical protein